MFNDSGIGIGKGESDPGFLTRLVEEYKSQPFVPGSCPDCIANGHMMRYIGWQLEQDPNLKVAGFSSYGDTILANTFLMLGPETFGQYVEQEAGRLMAEHDRFKAFLVEGGVHTTLGGDALEVVGAPVPGLDLGGIETTELDGVSIATWIGQMLGEDPAWVSHDERAAALLRALSQSSEPSRGAVSVHGHVGAVSVYGSSETGRQCSARRMWRVSEFP